MRFLVIMILPCLPFPLYSNSDYLAPGLKIPCPNIGGGRPIMDILLYTCWKCPLITKPPKHIMLPHNMLMCLSCRVDRCNLTWMSLDTVNF